jgi:hypothetical protein
MNDFLNFVQFLKFPCSSFSNNFLGLVQLLHLVGLDPFRFQVRLLGDFGGLPVGIGLGIGGMNAWRGWPEYRCGRDVQGRQVLVADFLLAAAGTFGGLPSASKQVPELVKSSPGRSIGRPIFGSSSLRD